MKQGWEEKKLGEVLIIERGGSPRPINKYLTNSTDGINWIKISDATASDKYIYETKEKITRDGLHKTRVVKDGDFILSNSMSFGRPYIMKTTGCIHDGWLVLKQNGKKIFETEFLYYLLSSPFVFQQFNSKAAGSTVRNLNIALVSSVNVPLPPLPEQKRIVKILDKAFQAIDKAKENAEKNLHNAKELFESYLNGIFANPGEDWEEKMLGEITTLLGDGLHGTPQYTVNGDYYFINGNNLYDGKIVFKENTKKVNIQEFEKYKKNINERTVLVSINGTLGNVAFYNNEKIILGKSACYFNLIKGVDKKYIKYVIQSPYFVNYAHKEATGATIKNVSLKTMRNLIVPLPQIEEQIQIVKKLDTLQTKTKRLEKLYQQKIADAEELKKSILKKAFKGEL